jgi:hypothetical protein
MIATRVTLTLAAGLCALALGACGGDAKPQAAPGSEANPLTATRPGEVSAPAASGSSAHAQGQGSKVPAGEPSTGAAKDQAPGYQALVDRQTAKPRHRFTPCNLVTGKEAQGIVGKAMQTPIEAPQGPTCIYRSQDGNRFITVALQNVEFGKIKRQIQRPSRVTVSSRTAYCGSYGQPMLYVPLAKGQVLSIAGPCAVAKKFAVKALPQL